MATNNDGLPEDKFINESYSKNPRPFWTWMAIIAAGVTFIWGSMNWLGMKMNEEISSKPFLQVTNRQFSLFLWQFSQFMRGNMPAKLDYLPGFNTGSKLGVKAEDAENTVRTPPEILFYYHTWDRLLKSEFIPRPIPLSEFLEFLDAQAAWKPENWPNAPSEYVSFVEKLSTSKQKDLAEVGLTDLPLDVRMAFQGWKNFYKEGDQINAIDPTGTEMETFLATNPHYARNYWRNILMDTQPKYLISVANGDASDDSLPANQLSGFLKIAFFNYTMAKQGQ